MPPRLSTTFTLHLDSHVFRAVVLVAEISVRTNSSSLNAATPEPHIIPHLLSSLGQQEVLLQGTFSHVCTQNFCLYASAVPIQVRLQHTWRETGQRKAVESVSCEGHGMQRGVVQYDSTRACMCVCVCVCLRARVRVLLGLGTLATAEGREQRQRYSHRTGKSLGGGLGQERAVLRRYRRQQGPQEGGQLRLKGGRAPRHRR